MKKKYEVATKGRGFLNELFDSDFENFVFVNRKDTTEITGERHTVLRKVFYSKLFDLLGIIQIVNFNSTFDGAISYNRFLNTRKPYYIICENPTALYHYKLNRKNGLYARHILKKKLLDDNLKGIICVSRACYDTFDQLLGYECGKKHQIYPLISDCQFEKKVNKNERLKCLYVSSTFELKSGCEIVEAAKQLPNVQFILVTRIANIPENTYNTIKKLDNIETIEFNLSKAELYGLYDKVDVLIHPTRQDSLPLVVLEAIKHGLPVLASNIYAIPEMVENNINGFLVDPKYCFFGKDNYPNPDVWNNREATIYSKYIDENIVAFLVEKIQLLDGDRNKLEELTNGSISLAKTRFSEAYIKSQWEELMKL